MTFSRTIVSTKTLFTLLFLPVFFMGACFIAPQVYHHSQAYYKGEEFCQELGSTPASQEMKMMVQQALSDMNVPFWRLVQIKEADEISCSFVWHIWIEEAEKVNLGPIEFVAYHEAAHVACGHGMTRFEYDISDAEARAQEKEADLFAAETLYKVGKIDVIYDRIAELQHAVDRHWGQPDTDDHPTFKQMVKYFTKFLESKGHKNVAAKVQKCIKTKYNEGQ